MKNILFSFVLLFSINSLQAQFTTGLEGASFSTVTGKELIGFPLQFLLLVLGHEMSFRYAAETRFYGDDITGFEFAAGVRIKRFNFSITNAINESPDSWNFRAGYRILGKKESTFKGRAGIIFMERATGLFLESIIEKNGFGISIQAAQLQDKDAKIIVPYISVGIQYSHGFIFKKKKKISPND